MTTTDENRFHALKFALQTPGIDPYEVTSLAEEYLAFLEGSAPAPVIATEDQLSAIMAEDEAEAAEIEAEAEAESELFADDAPFVTDEQIEPDALHPMEGSCEDEPFAFGDDEQIEIGHASDELFDEPDALTAKIQSAIVEIAPSPPAHPDETDAPEMTDEQVETLVLERMEAPPVQEPTVEAYINPSPYKKLFPWAT